MDYFVAQLQAQMKIAIPLEIVTQVISIKVKEICPIPGVKPSLLGVINQRGKLIWLLDIYSLMGQKLDKNYQKPSKLTIFLTKYGDKQFALVVQKIKEIINFSELENDIQVNKLKSDSIYIKEKLRIKDQDFNVIDLNAIYDYLDSSI